MPKNKANSEDRIRALNFQDKIEKLVKKFPPIEYATFVSSLIEKDLQDHKKSPMYPPHFLLHSIEANCAYHREYLKERINLHEISKILNEYINYDDPVAKFLLAPDKLLSHFFRTLAHQQFHLRTVYGVFDIGRAIILFID